MMQSEEQLEVQNVQFALWKLLVPIAFVCFLVGAFCSQLNIELYQHMNPFYDSIDYHHLMHAAVVETQTNGIVSGVQLVWNSGSTVLMPFLIGILVGVFAEPSRLIGVWIQMIYLFAFLGCLSWYLQRFQKTSLSTAGLVCFAFLACDCLYGANGGLSDFRVDLMLCLSFGCTAILMLAAMEKPSRTIYALVGVAATVTCLSRATAPVYLLVALGPIALWTLLRGIERSRHLQGQLIAALVTVLGTGWFFFLKFDRLYYYYVVWNTDANADLSISESIKHFEFAGRSIGENFALLLMIWLIAISIYTVRSLPKLPLWETLRGMGPSFVAMVWIGVSPVLFLVLRGAGNNPFVSMPAIVGMSVATLLLLAKTIESIGSKSLGRIATASLVFALASAAADGWEEHQPSGVNEMASLKQMVDTMVKDCRANGVGQINYSVTQVTSVCAGSVYSVATFDHDGFRKIDGQLECDGMAFQRKNTFDVAAEATWDEVAGETESEKIGTLISECEREIDYLVMPDEKTAAYIQQHYAFNVINRYQPNIREHLLANGWVAISEPIQANENETVIVYRSAKLSTKIANKLRTDDRQLH
ncbi:hypothetical protein [Rhodopirellula sp. MGV]|uniref:hypothetical protein n=1 Tax=Rhodopirellula sp. MGV TaxID=2023130 RepID=UPI000B96D6E2|nr:hypothetical protein [Rhodopirellula sp. MGV]OYP37907.1 hypothetical protein CGZ80_04055 [Rhodopirellula sp. MGV]PNY37084.1 hypothetical protein C2E31_09565 [Rhodopirellula baltica]